jgi:dihydrofolate reductase
MVILVAVDRNGAIGKNNGLLYRIPEDLKNFKALTTDNVVVMGRKTLESFPGGKPLPNRLNVVLSSRYENTEGYDNLLVARGALELFNLLGQNSQGKTVYLCGGESVYKAFAGACDGAIITEIDAETEGADAFFPHLLPEEGWQVTETTEWRTSVSGLRYRFVTLKKEA